MDDNFNTTDGNFNTTDGNFHQPADGSFSQPADGSFSQPADGSFSQPAEGSFSQPAEGSFSQPADGSFNQAPGGSFNQETGGYFNQAVETPGYGEFGRRANTPFYLERKSATVLMVIKLAEGMSKLCLTILAAFVLQSFVTGLNRIFQEGTTVADGKAMVAQFLKTLRFPMETIRQIVDAFPSDITISSRPVMLVFVICLPFVLIAALEAVAAIRLRLGKGGTRTIGILQMIYFVLGAISLLLTAIAAIGLSIIMIFRVGGTVSIVLSVISVSLAVFYILISLPTLFYHRNIARIMGDVRYEMKTGKPAERKKTNFKKILIILIVLEVIGVAASIAASWNPEQGGIAGALIIVALIGPAVKLVKYICVMFCYRNFMKEDGTRERREDVSHTPLFILILLVVLLFAVPDIILCMQSKVFSDVMVKKVEDFFSDARQTVDELSVVAEEQIQNVESAIADQTGIEAPDAAMQDAKESEGTAVSPKGAAKEETAGGTASKEAAAPAEDAAKKENVA